MASCATTAACALASPAPVESRAASRLHSTHSVGLPSLASPSQIASRATKKAPAACKRNTRNVAAMATGEAPAEAATELPEFVKTLQEAWDKLEDKYAVTSLGVAAVVGLWVSGGMLSAVDRLPLLPGIFELVGIGYTGWFAYRNLVFKPDREALIAKIKGIYCDIAGDSL